MPKLRTCKVTTKHQQLVLSACTSHTLTAILQLILFRISDHHLHASFNLQSTACTLQIVLMC